MLMRTAQRLSTGLATTTNRLDFTTIEGAVITIRADEIIAVLGTVEDRRSPVYRGERVVIFFGSREVIVRKSREQVLADIDRLL